MKRARPVTWKEYFENTKNNPPRPLLVKALEFVLERNSVLDLGAGALNDSKYLLSQDFKHVTALDKNALATEVAEVLPNDRFEYIIDSFEKFNFPDNAFDLISAQYALPFINPKEFKKVFANIRESLKAGGILTGQFFGDKDEWKDNTEMTFLSRLEIDTCLEGLTIIFIQEEEKDKTTSAGEMKHWHVFHFIAKKSKY